MRFGTKLIAGFVGVSLITVLVGASGWLMGNRFVGNINQMEQVIIPSLRLIGEIREDVETLRVATRTLMNPLLSLEERKTQYGHLEREKKEALNALNEYKKLVEEHLTGQEELLEKFSSAFSDYIKTTERFVSISKEMELTGIVNPQALYRNIEYFRGLHYRTMLNVANLLAWKEEFEGGDDASKCEFGRWLEGFSTSNPDLAAIIEKITQSHEAFHNAVRRIKETVAERDLPRANMIYRLDLKPAADETFGYFEQIINIISKSNGLYSDMVKLGMNDLRDKQKIVQSLLAEMTDKVNAIVEAQRSEIEKSTSSSRVIIGLAVVVGVALALLLGSYIAVSTTRLVRRISKGIQDGSELVASASAQVSSSSQRIAEMTSEQASALEETSSALEQMASMAERNAQDVATADGHMKEASSIAREAEDSIKSLIEALSEMNVASEEMSKIIKTIDEIAFQTNLLALNAAVEAARAGEAGAGFAVVAEEVRSLAMRSGEAAKNTSDLIEAAVNRVRQGMAIGSKTREVFEKFVEKIAEVSKLLENIALASQEQKEGIEQVNRAVAEMDRAVQNNAATAEESASVAEELNAQAEQLRAYVKELLEFVGTGNGGAPRRMEKGDEKLAEIVSEVEERRELRGRKNGGLMLPGNGGQDA
ncbi:methyl-accepting chemotaxis protein [Thermodesulforhabdus norvegica]|uniref:Methyl-accepting chemotaxis protein n=1 Tax=Thermodesulforhabdus norvegica TaxID=39841 RepID=A0A1I4QWT5_9BACT|nr:methyl-accepting chemotaxis protein [Thermodesulforhabdus norvegica]SFM44471.1 methyl-accepting chemotaxis protein [Thermodesulforhabdus norvegica]